MRSKVIILCLLFTFELKSNVQQSISPALKLHTLSIEAQKNNADEKKYHEIITQAKVYVHKLLRNNTETNLLYDGLLKNPSLTIQEIGPALTYLGGEFLSNAKSSDNFMSFLGLAMIQDERGLDLIAGKIMEKHYSTEIKSAYLELLALYGKKAAKLLPFLDYISDNEWNPDLVEMIKFVREKITSDDAYNEWKRYRLWVELKKKRKSYCSYLIDDKYMDFPQISDSNTNQFNALAHSDWKNLSSIGFSKEKILMIWKDAGKFKYIMKFIGKKGKLIAIDQYDKEYLINTGSIKKIDDLFIANNRIFLIRSWHHGGSGARFVDELIWDYQYKQYTLDAARFYLAKNYKEIVEKDESYTILGLDWKYKINKKNAVIESATLCGENVVINQAL